MYPHEILIGQHCAPRDSHLPLLLLYSAGILPLENFCDAVQQSVEQVASMDHGVQDVVASYVCHIVQQDSGNGTGASEPAPPAEDGGNGFANIFFRMPADRC